jgi:hypothetical protein
MTPEEFLESHTEQHEGGGWYVAIPLGELSGPDGVTMSIAAGEVGPRMYAFSEPIENLSTIFGYESVEVALLEVVKLGILKRKSVVRRVRPTDAGLPEFEPYFSPHQDVMGHVPLSVVLGVIQSRMRPDELSQNPDEEDWVTWAQPGGQDEGPMPRSEAEALVRREWPDAVFDDSVPWQITCQTEAGVVVAVLAVVDLEEPRAETMAPNRRWTQAYKNDLPDSAFLYVRPGCASHRDATGRSHPLTCRELPVKDRQGRYDEAHVRNAISRAMVLAGVSLAERRRLQAAAKKILAREFV